ncbi:hypothetical protein EFR01_34870 [Sinorhizobium fredii]|nr:hypothetical protein EFR01_34870 [Sinorhizobium fredii]
MVSPPLLGGSFLPPPRHGAANWAAPRLERGGLFAQERVEASVPRDPRSKACSVSKCYSDLCASDKTRAAVVADVAEGEIYCAWFT